MGQVLLSFVRFASSSSLVGLVEAEQCLADGRGTLSPPHPPTTHPPTLPPTPSTPHTLSSRFDDPPRVAPPPPETTRTTVGLDDSKPQQGLGELYEKEYVQAVTGEVEDKVRRGG